MDEAKSGRAHEKAWAIVEDLDMGDEDYEEAWAKMQELEKGNEDALEYKAEKETDKKEDGVEVIDLC